MKIYLASRYSRREELCEYRKQLEALGHEVTSRWLNGNHQIDDQGLSVEAKAEERTRFAVEDWEDLMAAECCISFTEVPRSSNSRGGRHVEFGAALADGQLCIVVGPRENVFHCLPHVLVVEEFSQVFEPINERAEFAKTQWYGEDGERAAIRGNLPEDEAKYKIAADYKELTGEHLEDDFSLYRGIAYRGFDKEVGGMGWLVGTGEAPEGVKTIPVWLADIY